MKGLKFRVWVSLGIILSACITSQVEAATYKWTDNNGQVNYTQIPPNNASTSTIISDPVLTLEVPTSQTQSSPITANQDSDLAIIEQYNCSEARNLLALLEEAGDKQVAVLDGQGNKKYLTTEERVDYSAKAKQDITKYCNG